MVQNTPSLPGHIKTFWKYRKFCVYYYTNGTLCEDKSESGEIIKKEENYLHKPELKWESLQVLKSLQDPVEQTNMIFWLLLLPH